MKGTPLPDHQTLTETEQENKVLETRFSNITTSPINEQNLSEEETKSKRMKLDVLDNCEDFII